MDSLPLIGLTGYFLESSHMQQKLRGLERQDVSLHLTDYYKAVVKVGGLPVLLPLLEEPLLAPLLSCLHGLVLTGGEDVDPLRYQESPITELGILSCERDRFEFALLKEARKQGLPILAICRGMQLLNVAQGGTLYQDLRVADKGFNEHAIFHYPKDQEVHPLTLFPSKTKESYGQEEIRVNSYHHQGIKTLGQELLVSARSKDGLVEGIELQGPEFAVGVQFHPEMLVDTNPSHLRLFRSFLSACKEKQARSNQ